MESCKCPRCWGLAEYMRELTGKDYGLPPASGHEARLVPLELVSATRSACDGSMTCECDGCVRDKMARVHRRTEPKARQPWEARPARFAA